MIIIIILVNAKIIYCYKYQGCWVLLPNSSLNFCVSFEEVYS